MARPRRHSSTNLDDAIAFRIHRTNRLLRTHLARFLDEHEPGLSPEQWFVLTRVADGARTRQIDLAEPVLGDPPNVSRLVDALVERDLVTRSTDPVDRRSSLLSVSERGGAVVSALHSSAVEERRRVFAGFDDAELDRLAAALDRIDENLREALRPTGSAPTIRVRAR